MPLHAALGLDLVVLHLLDNGLLFGLQHRRNLIQQLLVLFLNLGLRIEVVGIVVVPAATTTTVVVIVVVILILNAQILHDRIHDVVRERLNVDLRGLILSLVLVIAILIAELVYELIEL